MKGRGRKWKGKERHRTTCQDEGKRETAQVRKTRRKKTEKEENGK